MSEMDILARLSSLMGWQAKRDERGRGDILARLAELPIKPEERAGQELKEDLERLLSEMSDPEALAFEIELAALGARLGGWPAKAAPGSVPEREAETYRLKTALHGIQALTSLYLWARLMGWPANSLLIELAALTDIREQPQEPGWSQDMMARDREAFQALLEQFGELLGGWPDQWEAIDEAAISDPIALRRQLAASHFTRALEHLYWLRPTDK